MLITMKKCPLCQNVFDDVNDFCLNDGTPLVMIGGGAMDTPTQILSTPVPRADHTAPKSGSPMLYLVVGVLATRAYGGSRIYLSILRPYG